MLKRIEETTDFLTSKMAEPPKIGMITGTGLASLTERMAVDFRIPYDDVPNFPRSTIEGHKGTLAVGKLANVPMIALEGRFHIYEGYSLTEITFPVRVMAKLGVAYLLISSAAGGLNPKFEAGDLMIVSDHVNLTGTNPLIGPNLDTFGPRFPDMTQVYNSGLIRLAKHQALRHGVSLQQGVYVGVVGPCLETPADTRFLRMIGADAVGMSTVSEAIVGAHCGLKIIAIVVITNVNLPDCMSKTSIADVIAAAEKSGLGLAHLWEGIIENLSI
jgi:purine-nucleoside phosphorylase